jgi:hypothetical protein
MANSENITIETIQEKHLSLIGLLKNNWRKRNVEVYSHPTNSEKIVSVGYSFFNKEPIVCVEDKKDYSNVISQFPKMVIYN